MTEWFTEEQAGFIGGYGGAALGLIGGLYGLAAGILVPKGIGRCLVIGAHITLLVVGIILLGVGITAFFLGQPYHVTYPFVLMGFLMSMIFGILMLVMRRQYQLVEHRKMQAEELRRS